MSDRLSDGSTDARGALVALIRARLHMLLHPAPGRRGATTARPHLGLLRYAVIAGVVEFVAFSLASRLVDVVGGATGRLVLAPLLTWVSSAATVMVFLFAIPAVLATYTYNSDLRLLLLTPLSPRLIMIEKFLYVNAQLSALILLVGLPILLGVGFSLSLGPGYAAVAVVALLFMPVAPVAVSQIVLVAVLRWLPPRWARTITVVMGSLMAVAFYIGTQLLANKGSGHQSADLRSLLAQSSHAWWQSLPTTWPGNALAATAQTHAANAAGYLAGEIVLGVVLAGTAVVLTAYLFATGWATYQEVGGRRKTSAAGTRSAVPRSAAPLASINVSAGIAAPTGATNGIVLATIWRPLWRKEWRSLKRDPQLWARMVYPLAIVLFGLYRAFNPSGASHSASIITFFTTLGLCVYLLGVGFMALRVVNREGRALNILALAPIAPRDVVLVKWAFCALPPLAIVEAVMVAGVVLLKLALLKALLCFVTVAFLVIALNGMLLVLSLIWPRLDWSAPNRQVSGPAQFAGAFGGLALVGGICTLLVLILVSAPSDAARVAAGIGAMFALTIAISAAALAAGTYRMRRLLEGPA